MTITIDLVLLALIVGFALIASAVRDLIRAALSLAVISAVLAIIIFRLGAPYAAAFELSVAAGLITVLFISAISLINPDKETMKESRMITLGLPIATAAFGTLLWFGKKYIPALSFMESPHTAPIRETLWNLRSLDLVGQILIILTGVFLVILFFKENRS